MAKREGVIHRLCAGPTVGQNPGLQMAASIQARGGGDGYSPIRALAAPSVEREGLFQAIAAVGKGDVPRAGSPTA